MPKAFQKIKSFLFSMSLFAVGDVSVWGIFPLDWQRVIWYYWVFRPESGPRYRSGNTPFH